MIALAPVATAHALGNSIENHTNEDVHSLGLDDLFLLWNHMQLGLHIKPTILPSLMGHVQSHGEWLRRAFPIGIEQSVNKLVRLLTLHLPVNGLTRKSHLPHRLDCQTQNFRLRVNTNLSSTLQP